MRKMNLIVLQKSNDIFVDRITSSRGEDCRIWNFSFFLVTLQFDCGTFDISEQDREREKVGKEKIWTRTKRGEMWGSCSFLSSDSINYFSSSSRLVFLLLLLIYKLIYDQLILFCRCVVGFTHLYTLAAITRSPRPLWPSHRTGRDIACMPSDLPTC